MRIAGLTKHGMWSCVNRSSKMRNAFEWVFACRMPWTNARLRQLSNADHWILQNNFSTVVEVKLLGNMSTKWNRNDHSKNCLSTFVENDLRILPPKLFFINIFILQLFLVVFCQNIEFMFHSKYKIILINRKSVLKNSMYNWNKFEIMYNLK